MKAGMDMSVPFSKVLMQRRNRRSMVAPPDVNLPEPRRRSSLTARERLILGKRRTSRV